MEKIISYIENVTGEKNLSSKTWQEIVDEVILPKIANPRKDPSFFLISDEYMNFVTKFGKELMDIDPKLGTVLLNIAIRRLFSGELVKVIYARNEIICINNPSLPPEYVQYDTSRVLLQSDYRYNENSTYKNLITDACYNFLMNGIDICLRYRSISDTLTVVLSTMYVFFETLYESYSESDVPSDSYLGTYRPKWLEIYNRVCELLEEHIGFKGMYRIYARKELWKRHIKFFERHKKEINKKDFYDRIDTSPSFYEAYMVADIVIRLR